MVKPGYYIFEKTGHIVEVIDDNTEGPFYFNKVHKNALGAEHKLTVVSYKDLVLKANKFDRNKVLVDHVLWAPHEDSETWRHADTLEDAMDRALNEGFDVLYVSERPVPADPRDVIPDADWVIDQMLDNCTDNSMFWASQSGWLDNLPREKEEDLNLHLTRVICDWLDRHGLWPGWSMTGDDVRMIRLVDEVEEN